MDETSTIVNVDPREAGNPLDLLFLKQGTAVVLPALRDFIGALTIRAA